jgi:transposase-like protein
MDNEIQRLRYELGEDTANPKDSTRQLLGILVRRAVQEMLESEVDEFIGQPYYAQGAKRNGYRNGYEPSRIKTAEGALEVQRPQVRDANEAFQSQVWPNLKGYSERLEHMVVEMYVRGCSTRDIEELLKDNQGRLLLSKSSVSRISKRLWDEYQAFIKTDLSGVDIVYIFMDAVFESLRMTKSPNEGILVIWGIDSTGRKMLLHMQLGNRESYHNWQDALRNLHKRGLKDPVLAVSDGAPGLIRALREAFPKTLRQRCLFHKKGNILDKVPLEAQSEMKVALNAVYYAVDLKAALRAAEEFRQRYGKIYPSAVACFEDDLDACLNHLRCPAKHRRAISTTNLCERSFEEEKRRSKVIPRFFNEQSGIQLAFGTLIRASARWNRIKFTFQDQVKIMELREYLGHDAIKERKIVTKKHLMPSKLLQEK